MNRMGFQDVEGKIIWKIHFNSSPTYVFSFLSTDHGREKFWVEKSEQDGFHLNFVFPNGYKTTEKIHEIIVDQYLKISYMGSTVEFSLSTADEGTDLTVTDTGVEERFRTEVIAGWGSVLMNLKAVADHGVDLRNHNPNKTWDQGYFEN